MCELLLRFIHDTKSKHWAVVVCFFVLIFLFCLFCCFFYLITKTLILSSLRKCHHQKTERFQIKILIFFTFPFKTYSNEYPQYMFLSRNKKNSIHPCKPQFSYIKRQFFQTNYLRFLFENVPADNTLTFLKHINIFNKI